MRFRQLANLGMAYGYEQGTKGHRGPASFTGVLNKLGQAKVDLAAVLAGSAPVAPMAGAVAPRGSSVAALRAFHEGQSNNTKHQDQAKISALRSEVRRLRFWITAQGLMLDKDDNILWAADSSTVVYDHDLARQGVTRIWPSGGRLFTDATFREPLDTERMVTHFSGPGNAIYVMSKSGNIHVDSHKVGNRHHSSLLAGGKVAAAGELRVSNGYLKMLSNKSGHYRPNPDHLLQVIHIFDKAGVSGDYEVVLSAQIEKRFANVNALLDHFDLIEQPDYDLGKLLTYMHHFEPQRVALKNDKGWEWRTDPTRQKPAFYDNAGGLIAHKEVRAWFKGRGLTAKTDNHYS